MKKTKALKNFAKFVHAVLLSFFGDVITALDASTKFPDLPTPLATLTTLHASYAAAISAAATKDKVKVAIRNNMRLQVIAELKAACDYANTVAQGSEELVEESGFDKSKQPEPIHLVTPNPPLVKAGTQSGTLKSINKKQKGGVAVQHQYTEGEVTDNSVWITEATTSFKHEFKGLKPRTKYGVRIIIIGSKGQTAPSDAAYQYTI